MSRTVLWWLPLLWLAAIVAGFLVYGSSGHDDSHINFWFAHTLLERGEMVNYNGERVEQATNLLLVFFTALAAKLLPLDLVTIGYLIDVVACLACCSLLTYLALKVCPTVAIWPSLIALSCGSFLGWTFGGIGSVLAAFCLLASIAVWWRFIESPQLKPVNYVALLTVTTMVTLVRPEMSFVMPALGLYVLVFYFHNRVMRRRFINIVLLSVAGLLLLVFWQKFYFNSWFPIPVIAKNSDNVSSRLFTGSIYILFNGITNPVIGIALLLAIPASIKIFWEKKYRESGGGKSGATDSLGILLSGALLIYCGFVWLVGGDWMQGGRFLVPVIPLVALWITSVLMAIVKKPFVVHLLLVCLAVGSISWCPRFFDESSIGIPVWVRYRMLPEHASYSFFEQYNREHLRDMAIIDHLRDIIPPLHEKLGRPVRLLSSQAGMVFYRLAEEFPGMVQFTDLRSLTDSSLLSCPLLSNMRRDACGLSWSGYKEYFGMLPLLQEKCGILRPDILFDLNAVTRDPIHVFAEADYVMVHNESGLLSKNDTTLPTGRDGLLLNFMFVRKDILPLLPDPAPRIIDYNNMPLSERWGYKLFTL